MVEFVDCAVDSSAHQHRRCRPEKLLIGPSDRLRHALKIITILLEKKKLLRFLKAGRILYNQFNGLVNI